MTREELQKEVIGLIAKETGIDKDEIGSGDSFESLGLNSISAVYVLELMERKLGIRMEPIWFWDYPTVETFTDHLYDQLSPGGS